MTMKVLLPSLLIATLAMAACSGGSAPGDDSTTPPGGGPSQDGPESIVIPAITVSTAPADIEQGKALFTAKGCVACHRTDDTKLVGPGLKGIAARRTPKWMARMILAPEKMVAQDPEARALLAKYFTPMANQNINPASELPFLLAYLNSLP